MSAQRQPIPSTEFMDDAACRGKTAEFFPANGGPGSAAAKVCAECPVRRPCEAYASATGAVGFYAGRWRKGGPA